MAIVRDEEDDPPVTFKDVVCLAQSSLAIKVRIPGKGVLWIPQSQVHADSEVYNDGPNDSGKLVITHWIAEQKDLL